MKALYIASTGMGAQERNVEVISNNIANMSTTAYAPRAAQFADLHYQQLLPAGSISSETGTIVPAGIQLGMGVRPSTVAIEVRQGVLEATNNDLDLAVEGRGYFEIELPSGESAFTRDGKFNRSFEGLVVTSDGYPLADNIVIPDNARQVTIATDGTVTAYYDNVTGGEELGQITLTIFANEKGLEAMGSNLFRETGASGGPINGFPGTDGIGLMRQGYLEESSVDVVAEISELIEAQRGYELNSKVISAADEMLAATTRVR